MKSIDKFLDYINDSPLHADMFHRFSTEQFISMRCWPGLPNSSQRLFVWLIRPSLKTLPLATDNEFAFDSGKVFNLSHEKIHIGYIIAVSSNFVVQHTPTYLVVRRSQTIEPITEISDLPPLEHLLNNRHLSIFCMDGDYLIGAVAARLGDFMHS